MDIHLTFRSCLLVVDRSHRIQPCHVLRGGGVTGGGGSTQTGGQHRERGGWWCTPPWRSMGKYGVKERECHGEGGVGVVWF